MVEKRRIKERGVRDMKGKSWKGILALLSLSVVLLFVVAACGSDDAAPTQAPPAAEKPKLIFSDLNWDSAQVQNAIARKIVELGYDYETDAVFGGTVPLMQALTNGDTNITMEIWLPNQQEAYDTAIAAGTLTQIGNSLEDNWQSAFIIPQYVADANPGLRSVQDLRDHYEIFVTPDSKGKARLLGCIPGWECETGNQKKIDAYGLSDVVELINPGSGEALMAEIRSSISKEEPILFYYWGPTTLSHDLDTKLGGKVLLEEPPYTDGCLAAGSGCAYPTSEILIVLRTDLAEKAPDLVALFTNWDFNAGNQLAAEGYMADTSADYPEVAEWFLLNTEEWKSWVTPEARDKILAALS